MPPINWRSFKDEELVAQLPVFFRTFLRVLDTLWRSLQCCSMRIGRGKRQQGIRPNKMAGCLLLGLIALSGCSHRYVMTLNNGTRITTANKPQLKGSTYYFKDRSGRTNSEPAGRVREIAPASMVSDENTKFKAPTRK